jgi:hypothetical protein
MACCHVQGIIFLESTIWRGSIVACVSELVIFKKVPNCTRGVTLAQGETDLLTFVSVQCA